MHDSIVTAFKRVDTCAPICLPLTATPKSQLPLPVLVSNHNSLLLARAGALVRVRRRGWVHRHLGVCRGGIVA